LFEQHGKPSLKMAIVFQHKIASVRDNISFFRNVGPSEVIFSMPG